MCSRSYMVNKINIAMLNCPELVWDVKSERCIPFYKCSKRLVKHCE